MRALAAKLILALFGLLLTAGVSLGAMNVAAFLAAVTLSSLCSYFRSQRFTRVCCLIYLGVSTFVPAFCPFLPLFCFDLYGAGPKAAITLALIPLLASLSRQSFSFTAFLVVLVALAILLRFLCDQITDLSSENIQVKDDSREESRSLTEQNKYLRGRQDYEIHLATLRERNRIAREIHDNVGHILSRSILQAGALLAMNKDESLSEPFADLKGTLSFAMESIRGSVHNLKDDSVDLRAALEQMLDMSTYEISFDYGVTSAVPNEIKYCFIVTVKEGLTNIAKHSNATAIRVTVREHPALYQLLIHDNGEKKPHRTEGGMGLSNMEERVRALGGHFTADYINGFRIFISIPKQEGAEK